MLGFGCVLDAAILVQHCLTRNYNKHYHIHIFQHNLLTVVQLSQQLKTHNYAHPQDSVYHPLTRRVAALGNESTRVIDSCACVCVQIKAVRQSDCSVASRALR